MKRKVFAFLLAMILSVSVIGIPTASAKIGGSKEVVAGSSYTIKVSKSATAAVISGRISWSGFASGSDTMWAESKSGVNESITASTSIRISVPAGTPVGATCTVTVSGEIATSDGSSVSESSYSESKTFIVVAKTDKPKGDKKDAEPTPTPTPTAWDVAATQVETIEQGGTITVDITGEDRSIPASLYNAIREKQGSVTLNFGTYTATLNGAALGALGEDVSNLDLGLSFEPNADLSAAVGGADVYQLHFGHSGDFPGKISFTFKADKSAPGDEVYLYYYRSASGVIEGIQSATVDENGYVTFDIYRCSSYFVAAAPIEGAAGIVIKPEPTPEPTVEPTPEPTPEPADEPAIDASALASSAGFNLPVLIAVGAGAALVAIIITLIITKSGPFRKRTRRHAE